RCTTPTGFFSTTTLLQLDRSAGLLELLLDALGLGLRHGLLDGLRRTVNEILRLLEAEPGDLPDDLDDLDLLVPGARQDDREVLLLGCRRGCSAHRRPAHGRHRDRGRGRHAEL